MSEALFIVQIVLTIAIVGFVLMQKSSSIGLGVYAGSNHSLFGAKGAGNFLSRITFILGFLLVANTIALGYAYNSAGQKSVVDNNKLKPQVNLPNKLVPQAPVESPFGGLNSKK